MIQSHPSGTSIGEEALITGSTRELVEFYWSNRKRFSIDYLMPCTRRAPQFFGAPGDRSEVRVGESVI